MQVVSVEVVAFHYKNAAYSIKFTCTIVASLSFQHLGFCFLQNSAVVAQNEAVNRLKNSSKYFMKCLRTFLCVCVWGGGGRGVLFLHSTEGGSKSPE